MADKKEEKKKKGGAKTITRGDRAAMDARLKEIMGSFTTPDRRK